MSRLKQPAVGIYLRAARVEALLTPAEAARRVTMPEALLHAIERGRLVPSVLDATLLLRLYGKDPKTLLAFQEDESPQAQPPRSAFGRLMREGRKAKSLSPEALAHEIGEAPDRVRSWESGARLPPAYQLALIVRVLSLDPAATLAAILNPNGAQP